MSRAINDTTPHAFNDYEYNIKGTIPADPNAGTVENNGQRWQVLHPAVQTLLVEHIYPTHGQFADWESKTAYPAYMYKDHP